MVFISSSIFININSAIIQKKCVADGVSSARRFDVPFMCHHEKVDQNLYTSGVSNLTYVDQLNRICLHYPYIFLLLLIPNVNCFGIILFPPFSDLC